MSRLWIVATVATMAPSSSGCTRDSVASDSELRENVVGVWVIERMEEGIKFPTPGFTTWQFSQLGHWIVASPVCSGGAGTYEVKGGRLLLSFSEDEDREGVPEISNPAVVLSLKFIGDDAMETSFTGGKKVVWKRRSGVSYENE